MNIQSRLPTTADEFLAWNKHRPGKREFVNGRVVEMMINVTRSHYLLASRLVMQLASQLGLEDFIVGSADFGVLTPDGVRYPDILVEPASDDWKALATTKPLLLAEILSPSSIKDDFGPKARDYLAIASLRHYLVLSQDAVSLWLWTREGPDWRGPELIGETETPVDLPGLGVTLDLKALYAGIVST